MMKRYNKGTYKVVEINNMTALRSGQMAAQAAAIQEHFGNEDVLENGMILGYGEVELNGATTLGLVPYEKGAAIFLHYTEELFVEGVTQLNTFALEFDEEGVAYPRGLALNIGDVFTTNNVKAGDLAKEGIFIVENGLLTAVGELKEPAGHIFYGIKSYLPDGETPAVEFTYMGVK